MCEIDFILSWTFVELKRNFGWVNNIMYVEGEEKLSTLVQISK